MPAKTKTKGKASQNSHIYRGIREMVCVDASVATPAPANPAASGTLSVLISPLGVKAVKVASGPTVSTVPDFIPTLKWLYATSVNFREYRITRAKLVVVGNVASTATGNFNVTSSRDILDIYGTNTPSYSTGPAGVSVASLATRDASFSLNIDSSWKVVSPNTVQVLSDNATFINVHNVGDLAVGAYSISNNSNVPLGILYMDYDVEFRGPINPTLNS